MRTSLATAPDPDPEVTRCHHLEQTMIEELFDRYGLHVKWVEKNKSIPGTHFGDPEAGLIGSQLHLRPDTPIHSALHEACHFICMDNQRRTDLHTDAGGNYDEENAVCYLSILLADFIDGFNRDQMMLDMDAWGYTFRLGSARAWFETDAQDAQQFLLRHKIINQEDTPTWQLGDKL